MVLPSSVLRGTVGTPAAGPGVRTQMLRDTNPSFSIKIELSDIYFNINSLYVNIKKILLGHIICLDTLTCGSKHFGSNTPLVLANLF